MLLSAQRQVFFRFILLSELRFSMFAWSKEKDLFNFQYNNMQLLQFGCFTLSTKPESMDVGKHMPGCGVTRNKTSEYKHEKREKPNGV